MSTTDPPPSPGPDANGHAPARVEGRGLNKTTLQVRRAMAGDPESVEWVIHRFGPALAEQARFRMPRLLSGIYTSEDVIQDVWITVLPRLGALEPGSHGMTQVLLRYFSTAVVNRIHELARKHARGEHLERSQGSGTNLSRLIAESTGIHTRVHRGEAAKTLHETLEAMDPLDREIMILRGIEQHSNDEAAELIGEKANTVSRRYARALIKLRERLPNSIFADL